MILCFPIPGYVTSLLEGVQTESMKRVSIFIFLCLYSGMKLKRAISLKTDSRVQTVTESESVSLQTGTLAPKGKTNSNGCHTDDQGLWLGGQDER